MWWHGGQFSGGYRKAGLSILRYGDTANSSRKRKCIYISECFNYILRMLCTREKYNHSIQLPSSFGGHEEFLFKQLFCPFQECWCNLSRLACYCTFLCLPDVRLHSLNISFLFKVQSKLIVCVKHSDKDSATLWMSNLAACHNLASSVLSHCFSRDMFPCTVLP